MFWSLNLFVIFCHVTCLKAYYIHNSFLVYTSKTPCKTKYCFLSCSVSKSLSLSLSLSTNYMKKGVLNTLCPYLKSYYYLTYLTALKMKYYYSQCLGALPVVYLQESQQSGATFSKLQCFCNSCLCKIILFSA